MKLCIPVEMGKDNEPKVYGHFGSAPYFMIYDVDNGSSKLIDNGNQHHSHGTCNPMAALTNEKIDAVVTGGMGARAVQKLNENGIKVFRSIDKTPEELATKYKAGGLEEITPANACGNHGCH